MLLVPPQQLPEAMLAFLITILLCLPLHEFGHAWSAVKLGDTLPIYQGRLTLNPLRHIDWLGAGLLALVGFGWAKPVQVNPLALRLAPSLRVGLVVVAAAGPAVNVLLAVLAALLFRLGIDLPLVAWTLYFLVSINLSLALFNLIPVPPLDGSRILSMLLPEHYARYAGALNQYGPLALFAVFLLGGALISSMAGALTRVFVGL